MNLDLLITDLDGKPFADNSTVRSAIMGALLNNLPGDEKLSTPDKIKLFHLQNKVHSANGKADFTAEETALLKERVGKGYPALVVARVFAVIDPAALKS